jgi:hypothetical protein
MGAIAKYDPPQVVARICEEMEQGKSLRQVCAMEGMPNKWTVLRWLDADEGGEMRAQYARAREALADYYVEEIISIADEADDPQKARLQVDARKWVSSKLAPKRYGDKLETTLQGADGGPILIATGVVRAND